jgi:hypothetical protein
MPNSRTPLANSSHAWTEKKRKEILESAFYKTFRENLGLGGNV